jgi:myo-inositol-1(or 4)-monophosphatase
MQPILNDVKEIAYKAGEILRSGYGKKHDIHHKGVVDIVTEIDRQSEDLILSEIQKKFPEHSIIAEESGEIKGVNGNCWYIDPLDGTTNYAHGIPIFSVSMGYAENGKMKYGVVYDPMRDECFSAESGKGAWLNNDRIYVSQAEELVDCLLVTGFPYDIRTTEQPNIRNFTKFSFRTQAVRRLGSAALDLCYVAAGRLDGYWEIGIKPWDIAAGTLIIEEAGGKVTTLDGNKNYMVPPYALVTANPKIHSLMMDVLQED